MSIPPFLIENYLHEITDSLNKAKSSESLYKEIVNAPFSKSNKRMTATLGLGFITLVLVNKKGQTVDRIAMTDNELSQGAREVTVKPFEELIVPLSYKGNAVVDAVKSGTYQQTSDWNYLLAPVLKPEEARLNQAAAGIASSFIYPLGSPPTGALIFQYFITLDKIDKDHHEFMFRYAKLVSKIIDKDL